MLTAIIIALVSFVAGALLICASATINDYTTRHRLNAVGQVLLAASVLSVVYYILRS